MHIIDIDMVMVDGWYWLADYTYNSEMFGSNTCLSCKFNVIWLCIICFSLSFFVSYLVYFYLWLIDIEHCQTNILYKNFCLLQSNTELVTFQVSPSNHETVCYIIVYADSSLHIKDETDTMYLHYSNFE